VMGAVERRPCSAENAAQAAFCASIGAGAAECSKAGSLWIEILRGFSASGISCVSEAFAICALFSPKMAHRELKTTGACFGLC
jgi:hypothetical protein